MKWLSAGLTFVNVATVCGLLGGMAAHGLSRTVAILAAAAGLVAALFAYLGTNKAPAQELVTPKASSPIIDIPVVRDYRSIWLSLLTAIVAIAVVAGFNSGKWATPLWVIVFVFAIGSLIIPGSPRYRSVWLWVMIGFFAIFAVRSFCNVLFIDGNELKIQNPNNLGDLSLHLTYINHFASGVPLWPENPIYVFSTLKYPAGVDLFNSILLCLGIDLIRGLVWVGLLACAALCYALYRWGGTFTIAAFLFNGGLVGFQWFKTYQWIDYQSVPFIGWKSLALTMLVTQRGLLYALPVGLLLLYHWRARFFPPNQGEAPSAAQADGSETATPVKPARPILPFWVELTLYATLPLFHLHTFLALSIVLAFLFLLSNAPARKQLAWLVGAAFVPATFLVWLITDRFQAGSVLQWNPGWVQNNGDFARPLAAFAQQAATVTAAAPGFLGTLKHFFQFWAINFGITLPLILALVILLAIRTWKRRDDPAQVKIRLLAFLTTLAVAVAAFASLFAYLSLGYSPFVVLALIPPVALAVMIPLFAAALQRDWRQTVPITAASAFVLPAVVLFLFSCFVKTAPWEWDNIKLIIWAYLIVLPFVWSELVSRWPFLVRAVVCVMLFGSGFVTLFGGLAAGRTGFGLADRTEFDAVAVAVRKLPADARFAAFPTYNHPVLLQGRKLVLGYPGHVWTQGFNYGDNANKLTALMNGAPGWKKIAEDFHTRYLFWGREEIRNYPQSTRPWEKESKLVTSGPWGAIYDLVESPAPPAVVPTPSASPTPAVIPVPVVTPTPQGQ